MGRGEGGGGMQRSLDDFAVAPPHNSSVASIHGVPRERVRTRREPGGSYRILIHTPKIKSHFDKFVFVWVGNGQISMFLLEQVCSGLVQGQLLVGYRGVPQLNIVGYRGLVQGYRGCPS